jgi:hypothetical protein
VVTSLDKLSIHEESKEEGDEDEDVEEREEEEKSTHRPQRLYLNPLIDLLLSSKQVSIEWCCTYISTQYRSLCFTRSKCYRLVSKEGRQCGIDTLFNFIMVERRKRSHPRTRHPRPASSACPFWMLGYCLCWQDDCLE